MLDSGDLIILIIRISQEEYEFSVNDDVDATTVNPTAAEPIPTVEIVDDSDANLLNRSIEKEPNGIVLQNRNSNLTCKDERRHACKMCVRSFNRPFKLLAHIKIVHEGIRLFKCDQCDKNYANAYELKAHMRTHTGRYKNKH